MENKREDTGNQTDVPLPLQWLIAGIAFGISVWITLVVF